MGSRGSVIPFFLGRRASGVLPITDPAMTRFNITLEEGVDLVFYAIDHALGGEIFVPKIPSYRIMDLAKAIGPDCSYPVVGIRPGEKIHEEMITETDALQTLDTPDRYVIVPMLFDRNFDTLFKQYAEHYKGVAVPKGFHYQSGTNKEWLSPTQLREMIQKYCLPAGTTL